MNKYISFLLLLAFGFSYGQELNCTVTVNSQSMTNADQKIFKTLEKAVTEFVNNTRWTNKTYAPREKIDCTMFINVTSYASDQFVASIQVSSSRPIFDSTYSSPVFNYNDRDFSFRYIEFESLLYNPNSFDSNLVSVLAFYSNLIIGLDADTFAPLGGTEFLRKAQEAANTAQQSNYKGWKQSDGNQNRYFLINDLLSGTYEPIRTAMYEYHYKGLDTMSNDVKGGKTSIKEAIVLLNKVHSVRPNAFLTRIFFDAKSDELVSVFSGGPQISVTDLIDTLNRISPINTSKWVNIKF